MSWSVQRSGQTKQNVPLKSSKFASLPCNLAISTMYVASNVSVLWAAGIWAQSIAHPHVIKQGGLAGKVTLKRQASVVPVSTSTPLFWYFILYLFTMAWELVVVNQWTLQVPHNREATSQLPPDHLYLREPACCCQDSQIPLAPAGMANDEGGWKLKHTVFGEHHTDYLNAL